ncbi:hypothetical protein ABT297_34755 [Dactylosporangium sp. NPDC000555]
MRDRNLRAFLLGLGVAAVGVAMSDALARMTDRALRGRVGVRRA